MVKMWFGFLQDQHSQAIGSGRALDWVATVFTPKYHYLIAEIK